MSQGELTSCDNKKETGSKMRQLETDRLTNCDDEREIGSKSATMREKLAHKLQQFEGHGSQSVNERKIGSQTRERQRTSRSHSVSKRLTFLAYLNIVLLQND